jgi:hypothetical protein
MNLLFDLFLSELQNFRSVIETLLNSIPDRFSSFPSADSALGSVIVAGLAALVSSKSHECRVVSDSVRLGVADTLSYFKPHCRPLVMVLYLPPNQPPSTKPRLTQNQSSTSLGPSPGLRWVLIVLFKELELLCSWPRLNS